MACGKKKGKGKGKKVAEGAALASAKDEAIHKVDIKKINTSLPTYKYIKKLFLTDEEMIKTTTAKIKRFKEIEKILEREKNKNV